MAQAGFGNDEGDRFKIVFEDPETRARDCIVVDLMMRNTISDRLANAKGMDMVVLPGVGELKKNDIKAIKRVETSTSTLPDREYDPIIISKDGKRQTVKMWRQGGDLKTQYVHEDGSVTGDKRTPEIPTTDRWDQGKPTQEQWYYLRKGIANEHKLSTHLPFDAFMGIAKGAWNTHREDFYINIGKVAAEIEGKMYDKNLTKTSK